MVTSSVLRHWSRRLMRSAPQVWTYNPLTTALVDLPTYSKLIYHCVDDIAAQPAMPAAQIERFEADLVGRADHVFVTSRSLEARWSAIGRVTYLPNCVDDAHFRVAGDVESRMLGSIPRPRVGFVGAIAEYKVNSELLLEVADAHPEWSIVMIGPLQDSTARLVELLSKPNVFHLGSCRYADLPVLMKGLDVGLIPARLNRYTASMFPMKFFEYLAAGVSVVATELPALQEFDHVAAVVDDAEFVVAVEKVLAGSCPPVDRVQSVVTANSYTRRTGRMLAVIDQ
jgi:glycosyltransferase involved in cell wall biosynthesis